MTEELLRALHDRPLSLDQLIQRTGYPRGQLESALRVLQRGQYVDRAIPEQGACQTGCGGCSVKTLCPGHLETAPRGETWRLTDKGQARVTSSA